MRGVLNVVRMRTAATATALGITLSIAALASCSSPEHGVMPVPEPSVTPVFASEEEALAAAGEAYQRYLDVSNAIGQAGWVDTSGYEAVLADAALQEEVESAAEFATNGWVQVGASTFDSMVLQQLGDGGEADVRMIVYLCLDVSQVDVVDSAGTSVVASGRPERQSLEVELAGSADALLIDRSEAWSGESFC